ncbi:hypothetical protein GCM10009122_37710 [Fulvivirga kasyanovii]|uniref:TonB-dependent receptor n=2 Tax=Fulvivirga kasyanovii TaxID=396812 RepID=A0ABW9RKQ2_9BACT|nr:TonB-dependent receptor [Fulvivirga kasyanovii]
MNKHLQTMNYKFFFLLVLTCTLFRTGFAQKDEVSSDELMEMSLEDLMNIRVITPTRNVQGANEAPATVMVITAEQIKIRGYRTLAEVLNDLPDFIVNDKSDPQHYNVITSRGLQRQDLLLVLLDGIRISSPTNEPLPFLENFPLYIARQIEVVYGPGSALYGADAMAGVINIITQKADSQESSLQAIGGSQGYSSGNLFLNKTLKNDFHISVAGQYTHDMQPDFSEVYEEYNVDAYETGVFNTAYGPMTPQQPLTAGYEAPIKSYNFYSSLDKGGFSMKVLHHYVQVPSSTTLKPNNGVYNKDVFYGQGVTTGSASYTASTDRLESISTLTGSYYEVNPESNYRNLYGGMEHGYKYSMGSMMKIEEQLNYKVSEKVNLTGGATYEFFQSIPKAPELQEPVAKEGSIGGTLLNSATPDNPNGFEVKFFSLVYNNVGAYLQGQYAPVRNLSFTAGLRYDHNSRFGSTVNPRIGAVYSPFKHTTIKALYGTAFWAPSPHVSFESYGSFYTEDGGQTYQSGFLHLPNPNLEPVTSQMTELSLKQRVRRNLDLTLTLYNSRVENTITNVPDNGNTNLYNNEFLGWNVYYIEVPYNQGKQENYGGNIALNSVFSLGRIDFNLWSSISYVDGTVTLAGSDTETEQANLAPWQFRIGLDGSLGNLDFSARLLQAGAQRTASFVDSTNPDERETVDGYSLLNISTGYTFKNRATLFVNIQNALDQRYKNTVAWDASNPDSETFNSSFQNPLRVMAGLRFMF